MNRKTNKKPLRKQPQFPLKPVCAAVLLVFSVQTAQANPIGPTVVNGQASFATAGNLLTVTNTPGTIINWQGFSIGANEITRFAQQSASSAVLNRVISNNPSSILGALQSNGRVFLVNPNGIVFGAGATINVAGLVATTLNMSNADFLAGRYNFTQMPGAQNLSNAGSLSAQNGGQIYLIAPNVENTGVITAPNGEILLAAGHSVELVDSSNPNLRVNLTAPAGDATNVGQLVASSGSLGLFGTVVRNSGQVSADSATLQGGKIVFKASQRVEAGGTISAQGAGGGEIKLLADMQNGTVNISGTLDASAPVSGNGGFIDTSAAHVQVADTARITTAAPNGKSGTWLIDPNDYTIAASGGDITGSQLSTNLGSGNVTILSTSGASGTAGDVNVNDVVAWSANKLTLNAQNNININANLEGSGTAQLALEYGQGALTAGNTSDYRIAAGVQVNLPAGPNFSTLLGSDGVVRNYTVITALGAAGSTTGIDLQGMSGGLAGNYALGADIDATATSGWNTGAGFAPVGSSFTITFTGAFDGLGHTVGNLTIARPAESFVGLFGYSGGALRNVGLLNATVSGINYVGALAGYSYGDITNSYVENSISSVTGAFWVGGLVGENSGTIKDSHVFNVSVNGDGKVGGLAGMNAGTISNSYVDGGSNVTGTGNDVGGLVGLNRGTIDGSSVLFGQVSGSDYVGGLVGNGDYMGSIVTDSFVDNAAVAGTGSYVGGLMGYDSGEGTIANSYVLNSSVDGTNFVGGLAGGFGSCSWDCGSGISNSHVINTDVTGTANVGGLVGVNSNTISNSYVSSGYVWGDSSVGGLVGYNLGTLTNSHSDVDVVSVNDSNQVTLGGLYTTQFQSWLDGGRTPLVIGDYAATLPLIGGSYTISSVQGMKDMLAFADAGYSFTLANNITLPGGYNVPYLAGNFDGAGFVLSGLDISLPNSMFGLFNHVAAASTVSNLGLAVNGVNGHSQVGALAGLNEGSIINSYINNNTVNGSGGSVGGMAGINSGTISNSHISGGSVSGNDRVGGLVGQSSNGTINNHSYASGVTVNGSFDVGGLLGVSTTGSSSISDSYVSGGTVNDSGDNAGGLVGYNAGNISRSYVSGATVNGYASVGGLAGHNDGGEGGGALSNSYVSNSTIASSGSTSTPNAGGLAGWNNGSISNTYVSGGTVTSALGYTGGLVGDNAAAWNGTGSISNSFWNTQNTGQSSAFWTNTGILTNVLGLTTVQMTAMADFAAAGWDIASTGGAGKVWRIYEGSTTPLLTGFLKPLTVTADSVTKTLDDIAFSGGSVVYSGFVNGETPAVLGGILVYGGTAQGAVNAGSYTIIPSGQYSHQQGYDIQYVNGTLNVVTTTTVNTGVLADLVNTMLIPGNGAIGSSQSTISGEEKKEPPPVVVVDGETMPAGGNVRALPVCPL